MIKTLEEHVNAFKAARDFGILGAHYFDGIHVKSDLLIELANGNYSFASRDCDAYPVEVSTVINGERFFAICDENDLKNKFGGNVDELSTEN